MLTMMHKINKERCRKAPLFLRRTALIAGVVGSACFFPDVLAIAQAQPTPTTTSAPVPTALPGNDAIPPQDVPTLSTTGPGDGDVSDPTLPPSPAGVMTAYQLVDVATRAWKKLPPVPPISEESLSQLKPICGFCVQFRLDGRLIGRGTRISLDRPSTPEIAYSYLVDAYDQAFKQADASLNLPNDALRTENARLLAKRIMVSVDAAAATVPIEPNTWEDVVADCNPGMTGYVVRVGEQGRTLAVFPSVLLANNMMPHRGLSGVLAEALGEGGAAAVQDELKKVRENHAVKIYRFTSTHLAQPAAEVPPSFMSRGAKLVMTTTFTLAEIRDFAKNAADNLIRRMQSTEKSGSGLMAGSLRPWVTDDQPSEANPAEHAMALLALQRYSQVPGLTAEESARVQTAAVEGFNRLIAAVNKDGYPQNEWATPSLVIVLDSLLPLAQGDAQAARANAVTQASYTFTIFDATTGFAQRVNPTMWGIIAYALSVQAAQSHDAVALANAEACVRRVFADVEPDRLPAQLPWLGQAEIELAKAKTTEGSPAVNLPAAVALRQAREKVWSHQYSGVDATAATQDLIGGIVFTSAGTTPLPTWQSARVLAFAAIAMRDERLTERQEALREVSLMLRGIRFLRQLQCDEQTGWTGRISPLVMGGMRASPWDSTMPPDATSLSLLTISEALVSFDRLDVDGSKRAAKTAAENAAKNAPSGAPQPAQKP